jgi:predicted transposase/invertase (TIGR01784 family)
VLKRKLHDLWLRFLTEVGEHTEEIPQEFLDEKDIREAVEYMKIGAYTKDQLLTYDKCKIDVMTARSMLNEAEENGVEKGENKKAIAIALKMLQKGMAVDDICEYTSLSKLQIEQLIKTVHQ